MRTKPVVGATLLAMLLIPQGGWPFSWASSTEPAQLLQRDALCRGLPATVVGTDGDDRLSGTPGDDVIVGGRGDDAIRGLGGDDVLCGDRGTDRLDGGEGDDRVYGGLNGLQQPDPDNAPDNVGDDLVGGPGDDLLDPGWDEKTDGGGGFIPDQLSFAAATAGVRVDLAAGPAAGRATGDGEDTLVLGGRIQVVGTPYDDVLVSGDFSDDLIGGAGNDVLRGGKGRDYLQGDVGDLPGPNDVPYDDRVYGGPGGDGIYLGSGADLGRGGSGDDTLVHGWGRADLVAGAGDDYLETQLSFTRRQSVVDAGDGEDTTYVWSVSLGPKRLLDVEGRIDLRTGSVSVERGQVSRSAFVHGVETLRIPDGHWTVIGTARDETFFGGDLHRDAIVVRAGGGDDSVSGTPGDDELYGGAGRDKVIYASDGDIVRGFEVVRG
jgi:Ca2+-binding RTX toxin-like protein